MPTRLADGFGPERRPYNGRSPLIHPNVLVPPLAVCRDSARNGRCTDGRTSIAPIIRDAVPNAPETSDQKPGRSASGVWHPASRFRLLAAGGGLACIVGVAPEGAAEWLFERPLEGGALPGDQAIEGDGAIQDAAHRQRLLRQVAPADPGRAVNQQRAGHHPLVVG